MGETLKQICVLPFGDLLYVADLVRCHRSTDNLKLDISRFVAGCTDRVDFQLGQLLKYGILGLTANNVHYIKNDISA